VNDDEFLKEELLREDDEPEVRADEGRAQVPLHPADIAPSPGAMKSAYLKALEEIHQRRATTLAQGGYASQVQEEAFWAFYRALASACVAIVCECYPECQYAKNNRPSRGVYVVASAPGVRYFSLNIIGDLPGKNSKYILPSESDTLLDQSKLLWDLMRVSFVGSRSLAIELAIAQPRRT
jgi:hypothetical protein